MTLAEMQARMLTRPERRQTKRSQRLTRHLQQVASAITVPPPSAALAWRSSCGGPPTAWNHELVANDDDSSALSSAIPASRSSSSATTSSASASRAATPSRSKDPSGNVHGRSTPEWVDVRVTGVKGARAALGCPVPCSRQRAVPDGSRRAHFFEQNAAKMGTREASVGLPSQGRSRRGLQHWTTVRRGPQRRAVGSLRPRRRRRPRLPLRSGRGVASRGYRWAECPVPWLWSSDPRKWSVEL